MIGGPFDHCHDLAAKPAAACSHPRSYYHCASNCCPDCGHKWGGPDESRLRREGILPKPAESDADEAERKRIMASITRAAAEISLEEDAILKGKDDQIAALRQENEAAAKLPNYQKILAAAQRVNSELEKALSDTNTTLIEARETYRRAMAEITAERDQLKAGLAAMTERAEKAERSVASLVEHAPPGHPLHSCGGPQEACMQPGCAECGMPTMEQALAARADADAMIRLLRFARPYIRMDTTGPRDFKAEEKVEQIDAAIAAHDARKEAK